MLALLALLLASPVPADSTQLVLSVSRSWDATQAEVRRYERKPDGAWQPAGPAVSAVLGSAGLGWGRGLHASGLPGPAKREGDRRAPAGVFELRRAVGYAAAAPKTGLPYTQATDSLRCVDDPRSSFYNQLVDESRAHKDWTSAEEMHRPDDLYRLVVWVGHNDAPAEPGAGSCIFLHIRRTPAAPTVGCTAFGAADMEALMAWLDAKQRPVLVQLPQSALDSFRQAWGLP
jgi:L,D-peptidoglycan transpeptidase YkuD (ErfK/YbiS/YcfS/YnhG family)